MEAKSYYKYIKEFFRVEFFSAKEYRMNFIFQTFGMMINDLFWLFFWVLFFYRFNEVNGWGFNQMMLIYAVTLLSFGIAFGLFSNARRLARLIENGALDYYLTLPRNMLLQSIMKLRYSAVGDFFMGLIVAMIFVPFTKIHILIVVVFFSVILFLGWNIISGSITFFLGRFEHGARAMNDSIMVIIFNPFSVYHGWIKFFLLFVIPAGMIGAVPVSLIQDFSWKWLGILAITSFVFFGLGVILFYLGLKRYESGNVISMKD